ncbi:MAG: hypothetical protein Q8L08_07985 [Candidatus Nanopelagicaceae bacterium]|nr:hypothetical protein [Candidatus Nanopelagicaceae bacterium]
MKSGTGEATNIFDMASANHDTLSRFLDYSKALTNACKSHSEIIGLVLVGSTAETERVDAWSDHDFFVITPSGAQESLRTDLSWLPNSQSIAFSFRETEHGLKVVYDSGAVLEFAIFDCAELQSCMVNHNRLAYGDDEVAQALEIAKSREITENPTDNLRDFRLFLSVLIIGVGRARRGESLTAGENIRSTAVNAFLKVLTRQLEQDSRLDKFDARRRFELVHPEIGSQITDALAKQPEEAGKSLLDLADKFLAPIWVEYPLGEVLVVRKALSWSS